MPDGRRVIGLADLEVSDYLTNTKAKEKAILEAGRCCDRCGETAKIAECRAKLYCETSREAPRMA